MLKTMLLVITTGLMKLFRSQPAQLKIADPKKALLIFTMEPTGTLQVYAFQTQAETTAKAPIDKFYWRDAGSPQGYGPFVSVFAAMEHYKWYVMQAKKANRAPHRVLVIRVDFVKKVRVPNEIL